MEQDLENLWGALQVISPKDDDDVIRYLGVRLQLAQAEQLQGIRKALEGIQKVLEAVTSKAGDPSTRIKIWNKES